MRMHRLVDLILNERVDNDYTCRDVVAMRQSEQLPRTHTRSRV